MQQFDMNLGERIHGLNLLCGANFSDHELRIAMREVHSEIPDEMYNAAKKSPKNLFLAILQYQIVLPVNQIIYLTLNKKHCFRLLKNKSLV